MNRRSRKVAFDLSMADWRRLGLAGDGHGSMADADSYIRGLVLLEIARLRGEEARSDAPPNASLEATMYE